MKMVKMVILCYVYLTCRNIVIKFSLLIFMDYESVLFKLVTLYHCFQKNFGKGKNKNSSQSLRIKCCPESVRF